MEFINLEEVHRSTIDEPHTQEEFVFVGISEIEKGNHKDKPNETFVCDSSFVSRSHQCSTQVLSSTNVRNDPSPESVRPIDRDASSLITDQSLVYAATACSRGTCGVLDSGATKTVIGSQHVADLIAGFEPHIRKRLQRDKCNITFRFGNQGTLDATHSLVVPLGSLLLQIAIVPGATPFLVSNSLLRALRCTLDADRYEIRSPMLKDAVPLELTPKGLFLIDINKVADSAVIKPNQIIETFNVSEVIPHNQILAIVRINNEAADSNGTQSPNRESVFRVTSVDMQSWPTSTTA